MFSWYYRGFSQKAIKVWQSIIIIVIQEFSLPVLLRTLFAPWRRDIAPPSGALDEIIRTLLENFVSRFVGFFVRLFTIFTGFLVLLMVLIIGGVAIALVFLFPLLIPIGPAVVYLIFEIEKNKNPLLSMPLAQLVSSFKDPESSEKQLMPYMDYEAREIYSKSKDYSQFLKLLFQNKRIIFILNHIGLPLEALISANSDLEISLSQILFEAAKSAEVRISPTDLFLSCYSQDQQIQNFFENIKIKKDDILNLYFWEKAFYQTLHKTSPLLDPSKITTAGGIGRLWSAGYTPTLDKFSYEIGEKIAAQSPLHFEAHKDKISEIETILGRSGKHNVILIGEPGIGKRTVVLGLVHRVIFGETVPSLAHHRIVEFNIDALLAGSQSLGDIEARLLSALNEAVHAGNIILFVDNIDRLFEQREAKPGAIDLSASLIPYLERTDFQLIGTTNYDGYHKWVESNSSLVGNFEKIEIKEPTPNETLKIIQEIALYFEAENKILILYSALKEIISLSDKYMGDKEFPGKAIDLLDEVCSFLINNKREKILTSKIVEELITVKTKVPVGEVAAGEKERLVNLEDILHQRLVNQEEAVKAIAEALRRARAGIKSDKKPIGTFLFLGPTGVGKTEAAKTLAEAYFGSENRMVRFDMSEYQEVQSISRLIGGKVGEPGTLSSKIRENPFSLLLLDEIDKAHPDILNLFLQVLDEGKFTDSLGKEVDFKNVILIATSNAGSEWIREQVQKNAEIDKKIFLDYILKKGFFKPEFLNRFDAVVAFRSLKLEELKKIVDLMIKKLENQLLEKQIKIQLEDGAKTKLAELGFDPEFGARALKRVIQDKVEGKIAKLILENRLEAGSTYTISTEDIED